MARLFKVWGKEPITLQSSRIYSPPAGVEPAICGVEVRRLTQYANGAWRVVAAASEVLAALECCVLCCMLALLGSVKNKLCRNVSALFGLCLSFLRRGHANLLCIGPILTDDPRRGSYVPSSGTASHNEEQRATEPTSDHPFWPRNPSCAGSPFCLQCPSCRSASSRWWKRWVARPSHGYGGRSHCCCGNEVSNNHDAR
jgi:hypothetical protein